MSGTVTLPADAWQRLRTAGMLLSNVAKAAAETKGLAISPRCRQSLDDCRHEWDEALEAVQQQLAAPKKATGWGSPGPVADGG